MALTKITRSVLHQMRADIEDALKNVASAYGVRIKVGGTRFSETEANIKVQVNALDANGSPITATRACFPMMAESRNLDPDWLDKEFLHQGERYKIVGLNLRAKKYPVMTKHVHDGVSYKFPAKLVRECMENMMKTQSP